MVIHQYLLEISVSDKKYLFKLREILLNMGCVEKYSGDLSLFYTTIYTCKDDVVFSIGLSDNYYIEIYSKNKDVNKYLDLIAKVFPKNKVMIHYVIREI